ncbi:MAG: hypothetical protein JWL74_1080 [Alphaproteobacteria bacterium]|jgi:predicted GIY-YIG superfamily endonuclease|nr:hypothetical protein [Alphaproteobacteria bacterium]
MLHCRDRTFYVGHTDDLDTRIAQHEVGTFGGYTARKLPVKLVWSAEFPTREEAASFERRIKGWRREKKLALIRGDWTIISCLAKGKGRPSTSSGRPQVETAHRTETPGRPEPVEGRSCFLQRHPSSPCAAAGSLEVQVLRTVDAVHLSYVLSADTKSLVIAEPAPSRPRDELWRSTCFELFVESGDGGYWEFNFSPSTEWAAYAFDAYRSGMRRHDIVPRVKTRLARRSLIVRVSLPLPTSATVRANLTAVIEERDGTKSYWALSHPPEGPPDFHHPACFTLELPPAPAP